MNTIKYKWILSIISITIVITIAIQGYWNYKNYALNKQNFINQVQISLDNALEGYYADLAERNQMTIVDVDTHIDSLHASTDTILTKALSIKYDEVFKKGYSKITQILDSGKGYTFTNNNKLNQVQIFNGQKAADSLKLIQGIKSIIISIQRDTLDFEEFNPFLFKELERKKIKIPYALKHYTKDDTLVTYNTAIIQRDFLTTSSNSKFLKRNETLELNYPNATLIILKQGLTGILLSFLLSSIIIASLIYLLKIIKHQKQLAEVKNDLISNITHEFKTPITTISVALESIKNFNALDDKEKTKNYLNMSGEQLSKLNTMVEKLLETATLDSESVTLNTEELNLVDFIETITEKQRFLLKDKTLNFKHSHAIIPATIDVFHFENALNNIIDNAIKYGGDTITISLNKNLKSTSLSISDNGTSLTNVHKDKIFEQFYRVPKGNTHDVKGFGIGLYYSKTIVEKHQGVIALELSNKLTTFKITLPNV